MRKHRSTLPFRLSSVVLAFFAIAGVPVRSQTSMDAPLPALAVADRVVVLKGARQLLLMRDGEVLKAYGVSLGANPVGPKIRQGDSRTPEGIYVLDLHNSNSLYHRSIHISYPNKDDMARARRMGVRPGGDLFIHGLPNTYLGPSQHLGDWTEGCIALTNTDMDEIWRAVADGTPIEIRP